MTAVASDPTAPPSPARPTPPAPRVGLFGRSVGRRTGLVVLVGLVVVAGLASLAIGAKSIGIGSVVDALRSYDPTLDDHIIVRELRVPRTILALCIGSALGLAGAVMQGITRNPLADPGLLGINSGAALAVVGGVFVFGVSSTFATIWLGLLGAGVAGIVVYTLGSTGRGGATPVRLAIAGAAIAALCTSVTSSMLLLDAATLDVYRFWAVGSVAGRGFDVIAVVAPFLLVGAVLAIGCSRALDSMALGDDVARSLGQKVALVRAVTAAAIVLLCGTATAAAGPIWFVGLVVPHIARSLTGGAHRWLLPYSMLLGAVLLTSADVVGRMVTRPGELEVGVVTAFIGAPVFIAFVRRRRIAEL